MEERMPGLEPQLLDALDNPLHAWSVGTFGAIGEFMRGEDEVVRRVDRPGVHEIITERGALRVCARDDLQPVAYDTLSSDGETWGQSLALCLPIPDGSEDAGVVVALGHDGDALREEDRGAELFDLGVGQGLVRMCARTRDPSLAAALHALEGQPLGGPAGAEARERILAVSPHRVMLSPAARLEVYSPIPGPDGKSPMGPHTHLLPKLLAARRTHAANAPIPEGLQPVLMLHPRSPWRDGAGQRTSFRPELDAWFLDLLSDYGLADDASVRREVEEALAAGVDPQAFAWPKTRRGRTVARITLRRWAQEHGSDSVANWRALHDRRPDDETDEERLQHG
jgi:hypothetical protein